MAEFSTTQVGMLRSELESGKELGQIEMLTELGIGNHTGRICDLRKRYVAEGFSRNGDGSDVVVTEMRKVIKKNGRVALVAYYHIPADMLKDIRSHEVQS